MINQSPKLELTNARHTKTNQHFKSNQANTCIVRRRNKRNSDFVKCGILN